MKTAIAAENHQLEELDMLKDEGRAEEGSVSTEHDLGSRGSVHGVSLPEEKFQRDNSVDFMNLPMENTEEEALPTFKDTKSSKVPADVHSNLSRFLLHVRFYSTPVKFVIIFSIYKKIFSKFSFVDCHSRPIVSKFYCSHIQSCLFSFICSILSRERDWCKTRSMEKLADIFDSSI